MSDPYGIPDSMFGQVPEEFFGLLGRIVMVTSFLELRLLDLLTELDQVPQDVHAGKSGAVLIKGCRRKLSDYEPVFAEDARAVLDRVGEVLQQRNAVVHSIWPSSDPGGAYGWRPRLAGQREERTPWQPYGSIEVTGTELGGIITASVGLVGDLDRLRADAHRSRRATL